MPLNTNHPTPPKGASCSKVGIPEGVPRVIMGGKPSQYFGLFGVLVTVGVLLFLGGLCFGLECNLQDVLVALIDRGSLDQLRNRPTVNDVDRREVASVGLFLLALVMLEVVVQLFSGE